LDAPLPLAADDDDDEVLLLPPLIEDAPSPPPAAEVAMGTFPSFRAVTKASTNSLFSKKDFVEIPYDSNSCRICVTLMEDISFSNSSSEAVAVILWKDAPPPCKGGRRNNDL
jgi:hypothetical protein